MLENYRQRRIARPTDWIKQPVLDGLRGISRLVLAMLGGSRKRPLEEYVGRLLVIRRNRLGDAISVLPWLQGLKAKHPQMQIDVLANSYNAPIFQRSEVVNEVFVVPEKYFGNRLGVSFHPVIQRLRRARPYDRIVNASAAYSSQAAWLARLVPARSRVGVASERGAIWDLVWDQPVALDLSVREGHQVLRIQAVAAAAGLAPVDLPEPCLRNTRKRERDLVTLCTTVNRNESRWPDQHWEELAHLLEQSSLRIAWIGHRPGNASGPLLRPHNTDEFMNALGDSAIVICGEGGTSHLAPALGTATIAISGVHVQTTWRPWSHRAVLLEATGDVTSLLPVDVITQVTAWRAGLGFVAGPRAFPGQTDKVV
jgi:heptosyltransferase III